MLPPGGSGGFTLAIHSKSNTVKVEHLFIVGTRHQLLVAKTAFTISTNTLHRRFDAVLKKMKNSINFKSFMELCNTLLFGITELFPWSALVKAAESPPWWGDQKEVTDGQSTEETCKEAAVFPDALQKIVCQVFRPPVVQDFVKKCFLLFLVLRLLSLPLSCR